MATKQEFLTGMKALNEALNIADQCQNVLSTYLAEQQTTLRDMNELDFIAVWSNIALILQPVVNKLTNVTASDLFKEIQEMPQMHVSGLIIPK
jgi:hypothetical protein